MSPALIKAKLPSIAVVQQPEFWIGALLAVANVSAITQMPIELHVAGALLLAFVLPGTALINAIFPSERQIHIAERVVLSVGTSVALSVLVVWTLFLSQIRLTLPATLAAFDALIVILGACSILQRHKHPELRPAPLTRRDILFLLALALIASIGLYVVLSRLQYAELARDERDVVYGAIDTLVGKTTGLFSLPKGPAQILLVVLFARLTGSFLEGIVRIPFAVSGVIAAVGFALIAHVRVKWQFAVLAAMLVLFEGLLLPFARIVQYQMYVLAMVHLAIFCGLRAWATRQSPMAMRYWLLSAFFGGAGLLGHYDAGLAAPALLYLFVRSHRGQLLTRRTLAQLSVISLLGLLIGAPFYILLVARPQGLASVQGAYVNGRVDLSRGPFNHLQTFFLDGWHRGELYWGPIYLLVAVGVLIMLLPAFRRQRWFSVGAILLFAIPFMIWKPDALSVAGVNLSFALFALAFVFIWRVLEDPFWITISLCIFCVLFFTGFWMAAPLDHYFVALPPIVLIAIAVVSRLNMILKRRVPNVWLRRVLAVGLVVWVGWIGCYQYLLEVAYYEAVLVQHPERELPLLNFTALVDPEGQRIYNVGWRAVAVLYDSGELRGEYDTTESLGVPQFYVYHIWDVPKPSPRYFIVAHPQKSFTNKGAPDNLAQAYDLWGTITVDGDPQITIYQMKNSGAKPQPRTLREEDFEAEWAQLASLTRFEVYKANQRDDSAFYSLSHSLEARVMAQDALAFDLPEGRGILTQYYTGAQPILATLGDDLNAYSRIWGIYWGADTGSVERVFASRTFPSTFEWFGNVRLRLYGVAPDRPLRASDVKLGDIASLLSASTPPPVIPAGGLLPLQLVWRAEQPTSTRYKVFVHVIDAGGKAVAQYDDEPMAGLRPTTSWRTGDQTSDRIGIWLPLNIQAGRYQVAVGMYDMVDGLRLAAFEPNGSHIVNDAIPIGEITVAAQ
jgi:Protein of unknown function (DUF1616)/Dolichyl-phosphate-mannose-protein mannosyltransferase